MMMPDAVHFAFVPLIMPLEAALQTILTRLCALSAI
jgi:hypothetical protein